MVHSESEKEEELLALLSQEAGEEPASVEEFRDLNGEPATSWLREAARGDLAALVRLRMFFRLPVFV